MRKYWFLSCFLALFIAPTLIGCGGGQVSQDSAREQVDREAASGEAEEFDEPAEDENDFEE